MANSQHTKQNSGGGGLSGFLSKGMDLLSERVPQVNQLQHTLRQQAAIYNPSQAPETLKLQLLIKAGTGVVSDLTALSREMKLFSKNLYLWGKDEKGEDMVDVSDRLAYLTFLSAELHDQNAKRVEQSRQALKDLRNFETTLLPKTREVANLRTKLASFQNASPKADKQVAQLRADLLHLENEESTFNSSLQVLKRNKLKESFKLHFSAQKELGEKLAIVAGYAEVLLENFAAEGEMDGGYTGRDKSERIRVQVEKEVKEWNPTTPLIKLPDLTVPLPGATGLGRSNTSFGRTHEAELAALGGDVGHSVLPSPPSQATSFPTGHSQPTTTYQPYHSSSQTAAFAPAPVNFSPPHPALAPSSTNVPLNLSAVPPSSLPPSASISSLPQSPDLIPFNPTIAETGIPVSGSAGPKTGQLQPRTSSKDEGVKPQNLALFGSSEGDQHEWSVLEARERAEAERNQLDGETSPVLPPPPPAYGLMETEEERAAREAEEILSREREGKRVQY